jgi:hypothetical protein
MPRWLSQLEVRSICADRDPDRHRVGKAAERCAMQSDDCVLTGNRRHHEGCKITQNGQGHTVNWHPKGAHQRLRISANTEADVVQPVELAKPPRPRLGTGPGFGPATQ